MTRTALTFAATVILGAFLGACTETNLQYKVGGTLHQRNVDQAQCNAFGANNVPIWMVRDAWPIFDSAGNVITYQVDVYDANEGRRNQVINQCMAERGYQRVKIPYCKDEQLAGRSYSLEKKMPAPGPNICALRGQSGGVGLVDLNKTQPAG